MPRTNRFPLRQVLLALVLACMVGGCTTTLHHPEPEVSQRNECVVLLHGLWRSNFAMRPIEATLLDHGYTVVNLDYPSTRRSIEELARDYLAPAVTQCEKAVTGPVHLVSHSMGGIVIRQYLQNHSLEPQARVVMLSPPNQGAELAVVFRDWPLFGLLVGEAAASLSLDPPGILGELHPITPETGIIGGNVQARWLDLGLIPSPHDGTVAVASMPLAEMRDFLLVGENHVSIRRSTYVHEQILRFLQHGTFRHEALPSLAHSG